MREVIGGNNRVKIYILTSVYVLLVFRFFICHMHNASLNAALAVWTWVHSCYANEPFDNNRVCSG